MYNAAEAHGNVISLQEDIMNFTGVIFYTVKLLIQVVACHL